MAPAVSRHVREWIEIVSFPPPLPLFRVSRHVREWIETWMGAIPESVTWVSRHAREWIEIPSYSPFILLVFYLTSCT